MKIERFEQARTLRPVATATLFTLSEQLAAAGLYLVPSEPPHATRDSRPRGVEQTASAPLSKPSRTVFHRMPRNKGVSRARKRPGTPLARACVTSPQIIDANDTCF